MLRSGGAKVFLDRRQAGVELAGVLKDDYRHANALVLGIPRGGVVIAFEIAKALGAEMSVVITKKLPHPNNEELSIGAAAEDGSTFLAAAAQKLDRQTVQKVVESQLKEIKSRVQRFRNGRQLPEMFNRTVIIADDGMATGSTVVPAIKLCRSRKAGKVVVAVPVSGRQYVSEINYLADEVIVLEQPSDFTAVSQVYKDFHHLSDQEVIRLLNEYTAAKSRLI